jgi:hypothetical protein
VVAVGAAAAAAWLQLHSLSDICYLLGLSNELDNVVDEPSLIQFNLQ